MVSPEDLVAIAYECHEAGLAEDEIKKVLVLANSPKAVRPLTDDEQMIYSAAVARAGAMIPAFRDSVAIIRPYFDATTATLYTDATSRVGIGAAFFGPKTTPFLRATSILHEAMHVLMNHFVRDGNFKIPSRSNISCDLEINTILEGVPNSNVTGFILPQDSQFGFDSMLSAEQYDELLFRRFGNSKPNGGALGDSQPEGTPIASYPSLDDLSSESPGAPPPGSTGCDKPTDERSKAADAAGIQAASKSEQKVAKANTETRVSEAADAARQAGKGSLLAALNLVIASLQPPKADWRQLFANCLSIISDSFTRGSQEYTFRKPMRRNISPEFVFPGFIDYSPRAMLAIDTSGSMSSKDYMLLLSEVEGVINDVIKEKDSFSVFCVDTKPTEPTVVTAVEDIDLKGGGGTDMAAAILSVEKMRLRDQPQVLIIATDGGTPWPAVVKAMDNRQGRYEVIFLITQESAVSPAQEALDGICEVIDIS